MKSIHHLIEFLKDRFDFKEITLLPQTTTRYKKNTFGKFKPFEKIIYLNVKEEHKYKKMKYKAIIQKNFTFLAPTK